MRVLVAFGSKYGSTASLAGFIGEELRSRGYEVDVVDLRLDPDPEVESYDIIVLGSPVFVGKWTREARRFLESNGAQLCERKVALFVSCSDVLFPEKIESGRKMYLEDVAASVPGLRPVSLGMFGGVIDFSRYGALTKALLAGVGTKKQLAGRGIDVTSPYDYRDWEQVRSWARAL
ncbi:MAG: protoporphyrinogen oxidase [Methanomassiliicoccales archaeon PtaU1.Bin030]|nr:MAG: protoporphyrinogen oxidase [Methanomassiliicoccales archaeon PtaU1.Bin030]